LRSGGRADSRTARARRSGVTRSPPHRPPPYSTLVLRAGYRILALADPTAPADPTMGPAAHARSAVPLPPPLPGSTPRAGVAALPPPRSPPVAPAHTRGWSPTCGSVVHRPILPLAAPGCDPPATGAHRARPAQDRRHYRTPPRPPPASSLPQTP